MDLAYSECRTCELTDRKIDGLLGAMKAMRGGRAALLRRFGQMYVSGRTEPVCEPCIRAPVDAALDGAGGAP